MPLTIHQESSHNPQVQGHGGVQGWNKHGLLRAKPRDEVGHGIEEAKYRAKRCAGP